MLKLIPIYVASIAFLVCGLTNKASSQGVPVDPSYYISEAVWCGVSRELHEQFHQLLDAESVTNDERDLILQLIPQAQEWQQSFWDSAYETVQSRSVVKTPEYQANYAILSAEPAYRAVLDKSEQLLKRIAAGQPIELPPSAVQAAGLDVGQIVLDETIAEFVRDNVGVATDRIGSLMASQWPPDQKHFIYDEQNIEYYSDVRLAWRLLPAEDRLVRQWITTQNLSCSIEFSVLVADYSNATALQAVHAEYLSGLTSGGIQTLSTDSGTWHGYPYSETIISSGSSDQKLFSIVRTVRDTNEGFNYVFFVSSVNDVVEASNALVALLMRISVAR